MLFPIKAHFPLHPPSTNRKLHLASLLLLALVPPLLAQNLYWDTNNSTTGIQGGNGTWNTSQYWNSSSNGNGTFSGWTANSSAYFSASNSTVDLEGSTWDVDSMTVDGMIAVTLTNGTINLNSGLTTLGGFQAKTLNATIALTANQTFTLANTFSQYVNIAGALNIGAHELGINFEGGGMRSNISANLTGSGNIIISNGNPVLVDGLNGYAAQFTGNNTGFTGDYIINKGVLGAQSNLTGYTNKSAVQFGNTADDKDFNWNHSNAVTLGGLNSNGGSGAEYVTRGTWGGWHSVITIDTSVTGGGFNFAGTVLSKLGPSLYTGLTKAGAGTQGFSGTNTINGNLTITGGTLQLGNGGTTGSFTGINAITNNSNLTINRSNDFTQATDLNGKVITGSGSLTQAGSGRVILTAENTYSGGTTITAGTLQIGNGGTTGSIASTSGITNNATLAFNRSDTFTLSIAVTGSGGLMQAGSGTLVLSGSNSYTGATTLAAGSLQLENANAIGSTGDVTFTGGTLVFTANNTNDISSRIASSSSAITIDTNGLDVTFATGLSVSNAAGLVKNGNGTLILAANNSYAGSTTINGGTLQIGTGGASGSLASYSGTNNGTIVFNTSSTYTLTGAMIGTGNLIKEGSGTLNIQNNFYQATGEVVLNSGGLRAVNNNSFSSANTLKINGGTFLLDAGKSQTVSTLTLVGGDIVQYSSGNLSTLTATNGIVIEGGTVSSSVVLGGGSLTKNGSGTFTLSSANTYNGGTVLNTGTLVIGNTAGAGTGTITQTDGTSLLKFDTTGTVANNLSIYNVASNQTLTLSGNITAQNTTYDVASGTTLSLNGTISGNGGVTKIGDGTLELNAANTYTGDTVVNVGTLEAGAAGALGNSANITVNGGSFLVRASEAVGNATQRIQVNGGSLIVGANNAIGDTTAIGLSGGTMAFSGNVTDTIGALTLSANSVIDLGSGSVSVAFAGLSLGIYSLQFHNWTGTTLWNGGTGNDVDKVYFNQNLTAGQLAQISFYSDFGSTFLGTGFDLGFATGIGYHIIPVPEPETWVAAAVLLGGAGLAWLRSKGRRGLGEG